MLSKSQARAFFLGGSFIFSAVFIILTVDTVRQNDVRTNSQNLTESVLKGKLIWENNNCMGCHTLLGEGGYYAPDLTNVVDKRGAEWIKIFLDDPEAMFPGERKMVKYKFTKEEKSQIIDFLAWVGKIDTNGWPPAPNISSAGLSQSQDKVVVTNKTSMAMPVKFQQLCIACHAVGGSGGVVGPSLDHVGTKFDKEYLDKWLSDPQAVKPGTAMPKLPLSEMERKEIILYLSDLK
ncbi:c-type cytochrome [Leptospira sp. GIMC2001]|uniref:c-type cytochrome n=1 Tax=Leptospira sp. GIMC2001 TaxID=1513297 RepID=UPI00234A9517|nr:c-type cytochrome [Leptospira sp. GIMC2001]WCL49870.1 c-type cytochrome [Leptospira sp. GIMC2001]